MCEIHPKMPIQGICFEQTCKQRLFCNTCSQNHEKHLQYTTDQLKSEVSDLLQVVKSKLTNKETHHSVIKKTIGSMIIYTQNLGEYLQQLQLDIDDKYQQLVNSHQQIKKLSSLNKQNLNLTNQQLFKTLISHLNIFDGHVVLNGMSGHLIDLGILDAELTKIETRFKDIGFGIRCDLEKAMCNSYVNIHSEMKSGEKITDASENQRQFVGDQKLLIGFQQLRGLIPYQQLYYAKARQRGNKCILCLCKKTLGSDEYNRKMGQRYGPIQVDEEARDLIDCLPQKRRFKQYGVVTDSGIFLHELQFFFEKKKKYCSCCYWSSDVIVNEMQGEVNMKSLFSAIMKADNQECQLCREGGALMKCNHPNCNVWVHYLCFLRLNRDQRYLDSNEKFRIRCPKHQEINASLPSYMKRVFHTKRNIIRNSI